MGKRAIQRRRWWRFIPTLDTLLLWGVPSITTVLIAIIESFDLIRLMGGWAVVVGTVSGIVWGAAVLAYGHSLRGIGHEQAAKTR